MFSNRNFFSSDSSDSAEIVENRPKTLLTSKPFILYTKETRSIFETMIPRLKRSSTDPSNPLRELLAANLRLLKQMQRSYDTYDAERKSEPYVHRFSEELMRDIEHQLFENIVGRLRVEAICLRNVKSNSSFSLRVKHADFVGTIDLSMTDAQKWDIEYFVGGRRKDFIEVRVNPLRPLEFSLFRRGFLRSLKCTASRLGEKVSWETTDLLGLRSFHDVAFGEVSARLLVTWLPYVWTKEKKDLGEPNIDDP